MKALLVWIGVSLAAAIALLIALPGERGLVIDIWFLAAGGLAVLAALRATVERLPAEQPSPIDEPPPRRTDERPSHFGPSPLKRWPSEALSVVVSCTT